MAGNGPLRISHFRVEEQLQRDELGYFFRAIDEQLDRPVVLRVVRAGELKHSDASGPMRQRIRKNARAAAHVSHPNLVTIHEFRSLSETDIVVMELVDGPTLQELRNEGRRWTVVELSRLLARLADALATAHEAGLVHGNVNASNVRVRPDGRFKLLDLGIPKLDTVDDSVPHDPADDVRGLAHAACELLGPPIDVMSEAKPERLHDPLSDPTTARAHYGMLAPVLRHALRDPKGYADAAAFRDAVLQAMEMASGRAGMGRDFERGFSTHVVGPSAKLALEDTLPAESTVLEPISHGAAAVGPRLVLPEDLAERAPAEALGAHEMKFVPRKPAWHRISRFFGPKITIAALLMLAVVIAVGFAVRRASVSTAAAAAALEPEITAPPDGPELAAADSPGAGVLPTLDDGGGTASGEDSVAPPVTSAPATAPARATPVFRAPVLANPPGTTIRVVDGEGGPWTNQADIDIPAGDTITLEFSRPGYVTQRRLYAGSRISLTLQPDSAVARFRSNVPVQVFLASGSGERLLGTTNLDVRLPTGNHRVIFRAPGQPEWETRTAMTQAGAAYDVVKSDYQTLGSLMATTSPTWAQVSVDGGLAKETPARFDSLTVGRHIVTVTRDGFATIIDTVIVAAGDVVRRNYTVRR